MHLTKMLWLGLFLAVVGLNPSALANSSDFALRDALCDRMLAPRTDALGELQGNQREVYFRQPIPLIVHHIWFGSPLHFEDERSARWQEMANQFGYIYHLWTEDDDPYLAQLMGDDLFAYMDRLRKVGRYDAASDICRYVLLEHMGGIYTDVDVGPPEEEGSLVDLRDIIALQGLVVTSEKQVREVGNSAFYAQNDVIMASAHHPVMRQMVAGLLPNHDKFVAAGGNWDRGAQFFTGQIYWNMTINGPFSVLPLKYMRRFNMHCEPRPQLNEYLEYRYWSRFGEPNGRRIHSIHTAPF